MEALTIDIQVRQMGISCTTAFGPQESADIKKKTEFWNYLTEEATRAKKIKERDLCYRLTYTHGLGPK